MVMKCPLVLLSVLVVVVKVASSEWVLGVQIQHFENFYNAEFNMDEGKYCCCDNPGLECSENITNLHKLCTDLKEPIHDCQPYFLIHVEDCPYNSNCSLDKTYKMNNESTYLDQLVLYIPLRKSELSSQSELIVEVWDFDGQYNPDDMIDEFTFQISEPLTSFHHSDPTTTLGKMGVANLTVTFGNITADMTACTVINQPTFNSYTIEDPCSNSSFSTASTPVNEAVSGPVWTVLTILLLLVAVIFAVTSLVLGFIVYHTRKDVKSWISSKLSKHQEQSATGFEKEDDTGIQGEEESQHVYSTIYKKTKKVSNEPNYENTTALRKEKGFYDLVTSEGEFQDNP